MRKGLMNWIWLLALLALVPWAAVGAAATEGETAKLTAPLDTLLDNEDSRRYIRAMLGYYLEKDPTVRKTLEAGYSAVFFFEGCSDNMDDPELSDISYYRVSAVCLAVRLGEDGKPYLSYYNENCSTLPDRPLEYGAWELERVGEVGPATIRDGTYELFSVRHGGAYEALHIRAEESDATLPAVYMTPRGYTTARATHINIHTRTVNHVIRGAMWSSGCLLVGDGDFGYFQELMDAVYYAVYDTFDVGLPVGCLTVDRQMLKGELYSLYKNTDAVDMLLADSRRVSPETYLRRCEGVKGFGEPLRLWITEETELMSLPCANTTDPRSVPIAVLDPGTETEAVAAVRNTAGNLWYVVEYQGSRSYLFSGCTQQEQPGWWERLIQKVFG